MIIEEKDLKQGELPVNKIVHGHALDVLKKLPSNSIDCVVTSPPYWGKRVYPEESVVVWGGSEYCEHDWVKGGKPLTKVGMEGYDDPKHQSARTDRPEPGEFCKKCGAWLGQLGLEPDPFMYVDHLIQIFREIKRVLKPTGNVFCVIDDTYARSGSWSSGGGLKYTKKVSGRGSESRTPRASHLQRILRVHREKSLCLVPELFALRMVYDLGFVLRNKIIWAKKVHFWKERETKGNAMPESVKDRLSHSWEYVYHFVKNSDAYYYDLDAVRVYPKTLKEEMRRRSFYNPVSYNSKYPEGVGKTQRFTKTPRSARYSPLGANPGNVLQCNTEPFPDSHFAVFPRELVRFLLSMGCPQEGVVLDPFLGSGTTALVALQMGMRFVGIEIVREYCEMAERRIKPHLAQKKLFVF